MLIRKNPSSCQSLPTRPAAEMGWELVQDLEGIQLKTIKLENPEGLERAQQCSIKTIPTMIIYRGKEECERMVGLPKKKNLEESLKRYLV